MDKQGLVKQVDKPNLQTLKGFRDFLPKVAKKRNFALDIVKNIFRIYGFEPLETPALEYESVLLGKYGEEGDKLMYKFTDNGDRKVALRYDQTVPTARVLGSNFQNLPIPFKRYQIQPVWRAENTQAGRYREFLQCDADIYGSASPLADADIIATSYQIIKALGFNKFHIFLNDRNLLFELMNFASIPTDLHLATISEIDKLDRKTKDEVSESLSKVGLTDVSIEHLFHHLEEAQPNEFIKKIMATAIQLGVDEGTLTFQARLARGLDYYTSTIFEIKIDDYKGGSVLGGGRYDNLIGKLSGTEIPAVGFALGFDRTIEAMDQFGLFPSDTQRSGVLVSVFGKDLLTDSLALVQNLRANGVSSEIYPDDNARLDKQLKFADKKGLRWFIVIGSDEVKKNSVILKDLETGHQDDVPLKDLINKVVSDKK